jgi:hypothetical protein
MTSRQIAPTDIQSFICDVIAPVATGVQATDTANLQAAINATPSGGWLHIPRGTYQINAALVLANPIRITGAGVYETFTGNNLPDTPFASPFLFGTVIVQNTAATDAIQLTGALQIVHLSDFGIMFASSISFANTGHGINTLPPVVSGQTFHQTSLVKSTWKNITVFGHDGNHYGFNFLNVLVLTLDTLRAHGGGIMAFVADNPTVNYGNVVAIHPYGVLMTAGSSNAYHLQGADTGSFGAINLMTFIRPQVNSENLTAHFPTSTVPTSSQFLWFTDQTTAPSGASYVRGVRIINPDFESDVGGGVTNPIQFNDSIFVDASGTMPNVAYLTTPDYNPTSQPTVAVLAGAGTGATASVTGGTVPSDLAGTVSLTTGTGTSNGDLFTVTFGTPLFKTPKFVAVFLTFALTGVSQQFTVHTFSASGFTVQSNGTNPTASTGYQVSWKVEQ